MDQPTWERRRYWHDGALRQLEWWQGNQPVPRGPQQRPVVVLRREFCYRHGTQIYPDLGCQDTVAHMIQNRFYCGLVEYKGEWHPGQHEAVTTEAMIAEITAKAQANSKGRAAAGAPTGRVYLLNRRLFCAACGEPLRVQPSSTGKVRFVCTAPARGLSCTAHKRSIAQEVLEQQIAGLIGAVHLPPAYREEALQLLGEVDPQSEEAQIRGRREALLAELDRCKHAFKIGASEQAEFDADVRCIRHELEGLPASTTTEARLLSMEEAARYLDEVRTL